MKKNYIGVQTNQAVENFPLPVARVDLDLIKAIVEIKKAAALANQKAGKLDVAKTKRIVKACDTLLSGKYEDRFVTPSIQGGAGTSINMNVNEVIAILSSTHPNDDVNMSQSTNDVNPSALRIVALRLIKQLVLSFDELIGEFNNKIKEFGSIPKLGRTHLQDAVPTTYGEEFGSYTYTLERDKKRLYETIPYLADLNLGGTAIGNSINAPRLYINYVYKELCDITKLPLKPAKNFMSLTGFATDFYHLSSILTAIALDLSKISTDIRTLASGPKGGIGEIVLESRQAGSSIMPGKVNPVMPELMNQVYYFISGKNLTIQQSAEGSSLELAIMFPPIAEGLIASLKLFDSSLHLFSSKCIKTLRIDVKRSKELLEKSTAYATLLTPILGYDAVAMVVKTSLQKNKTIREVVLEKKLLTEKQFEDFVKN